VKNDIGSLTPVSCAIVKVATTSGVFDVVTTALRDIDLATSRPVAVNRLLGHHPDGRPEPVAFGHLCDNLDLTIANALLSLGSQACRSDRRDHGALLGVGSDEARRVRAACAGTVTALLVADVECVVGPHLIWCDGCCLIREGRHDVQTLCVDIAILLIGRGPIEGAVTEAIDLNFMRPYIGVESLEVVFVDETELSVLLAKTIHQQGCKNETDIGLTVRPNGEETNDTSTDDAR
jgi:hypothetical protein